MARILLSKPDVGGLEAKYVQEALSSGWVAPAGPDLDAFECEIRDRVGVAYAVAVSSGTAALHLGLMCADVKPGDVVLTSTMTFAATANAITYVGAEPFFVDSDRETGNIDVTLLAKAATVVQQGGRRIGAILPVDLLGKCADLTAIETVAKELGVPLLVDAAESVGSFHNGQPSGSFGDASVFSFNGNKVMTTSGGGMLLTQDAGTANRARYLSTQARQPVVHYQHTEVGYNYRLSNILAALGRAQLARLDRMIARRRAIRERYRSLFADIPGVSIFGGDDTQDNCWLTSVIVDETSRWSAGDLAAHLSEYGIETRPLWKPMHLQPAFGYADALENGNAEWLFEHGLTLPSGSGMSTDDIDRVTSTIDAFVTAW